MGEISNKNVSSVAVFNVLCSSEEKVRRLRESVSRLAQVRTLAISVRARGKFAALAISALNEISRSHGIELSIHGDDPELSWRDQTLEQVMAVECERIFLLQEDHWLVNPKSFSRLVESELHFDFCPVSFFPQVEILRRKVNLSMATHDKDGLSRVSFLWSTDTKGLQSHFAVSLVGLFGKTYLLRMLRARLQFPFFYDHRTPFVFERKFGDPSVMPLRLALPHEEIFCCVDDDNGIPGSSLASRGLVPWQVLRETNHAPTWINRLSGFQHRMFVNLPRGLAEKIRLFLGLPIWVKYYLSYYLVERRRSA